MNISEELKRRLEERKSNTTKINTETKKQSLSSSTVDILKNRLGQRKAVTEFGLDTLSSDLTSITKTLDSVYNGWQTKETMKNTLSSVQSMYDRIGKYQEYQKQYGGTDLSDLQKTLKSTIDDWDNLSRNYGKYKSAKEYNKAVKASNDLYKKQSSADIGALQTEITSLEDILKNVEAHESNIRGLENKKNTWEHRSNGLKTDMGYGSKVEEAQKELAKYLKSVGYDNVDALKKDLGEKKVFKTQAERLQNLNAMTSVGDKTSKNYDKEYDKYVELGQSIPTNEVGTSKRRKPVGKGRVANTPKVNDDLREVALAFERRQSGQTSATSDNYYDKGAIFDLMTDEEFNNFYYYLGKDKEDGGNKAQEYVDAIIENLNSRRSEDIAKMVKDTPWGELGFALEAGLDQWSSGMKANFSDKDYIPTSPIQYASGIVRDDIEYEHGKFARTMYDLGVTGANQLPSILASSALGAIAPVGLVGASAKMASGIAKGAGLATMYGGARGNAYQEMLNLGYDKDQATTYARLVGASEVGLQALLGGISKLGGTSAMVAKMVDGIDNGLARFAIKYPLSMASEATEEGLQEILNPMFQNIAAGYDTGAEVDWSEVAYSALLGGLMGGMFEGPGLVGESVAEHRYNKGMGQTIKANERVSDLFDIASMPEVASAYETYTRYANKGITTENISDVQLGRLYGKAKADNVDILNSKESTEEQKTDALKRLAELSNLETENTVRKEAKQEFNVGEETKVTESGDAIDIKSLKVKGDAVTVSTEKGEISIDEVTLTQNDAELAVLAKGIAKTDGEDVANLFISQYDGKTNPEAYAISFNQTMAYAKNNYTHDEILNKKGNLSAEQVSAIYAETRIKADKERAEYIKKLNKKMADKGFYKGYIDESVIDYNNTSAEGKVNWNDLTARQRNAVTFIKGFAQATGMNLEFVANNSKYNGYYDKATNIMYINLDKGGFDAINNIHETIIPTMSHETTHWMKEKSPELWRNLNEIVFSTLTEHYNSNTEQAIKDKIALLDRLEPRVKHTEEDAKGRVITEEDLIRAEMNRKGKSEDVSREEIIARACEDMLKMSEQGRKIFFSLSEAEQKTLVGKIKSLINDLLNWVNDLLNSYESTSTEARIMREYKEQLQKASKVWDEMLKKSVEANQSLEKSGAYEHKKSTSEGDVLEQAKELDSNGNSYWQIETEKDIFAGIDTVNELQKAAYNFILNGDKGNKIFGTIDGAKIEFIRVSAREYVYGEASKTLTTEEYKQKMRMSTSIIDLIENASIEYDSPDHKNHKLFPNGFKNYQGRVGIDETIFRYIVRVGKSKDGMIFYDINLEVDGKVPRANRTSLIKSSTSNDSILNSDKNVKEKNSDKDSTGRELSKGQQEYFKDSTVRDENGNLLVMYQGASEDFTVFDRKKSSYANLYGRGFYFTKSENHASQYGNTRAYYLNIKHPVSTTETTITKPQLRKFLQAVIENEDYSFENYGYGATVDSVLQSTYGKSDFLMLNDVSQTAIGDLVEAVELFNEVNGTDYDGIILSTETVTFNSEQAKLTSNLNPTKDKDMRFSMKENVEETKDLIAVHNLSPEKLLKTLKLGGLPMPSIAITRAREGYTNFGDISLVFGKDTIDPQFMRSNKIYSGDAWTPTYPQIAYKLNTKAQEKIKKKIDALVPSNVQSDLGGTHLDSHNMEYELNRHGDMVTTYRYNSAMKYAFLKDNNVDIELPTKEEPLYRYGEVSNSAVISFAHKMVDGLKTVNSLLEQHSSKLMADTELINGIATVLNEEAISTADENSEAYQKLVENPLYKPEDIDLSTVLGMLESARKYFHTNGKIEQKVDYREARTLIDEKTDMSKYESWLKKLFSDVIAKEGIRNNKDLYTPSGNRRSFEALHYEHTLENVIKAMKEEGTKGIGGFGGGNIFGASTKEYSSIDDVKADAENRMQTLPESKYDEIKKGFSDRLFELAQSLPIHKDRFSAIDDAANMLIEAVSKFKTKSGMANYLRTESKGWANYSDYIVDDLVELVNDIRNMPVAYFEAKPQRAVGYDEIKAVIMPAQESYEDDLSEVKSELEKFGVPILEYEYGDNNDRLKALNSLEDVRFSEKDSEYLELAKDPIKNEARLREMVYEAAKKAGYTDDSSWRMEHSAPNSRDDVSLDKLKESGLVPNDFWEHPEWYTYTAEERESYYKVKKALERQEKLTSEGKTRDAYMWVYRAVDKTKNTKEDYFRNGDWVTPSYDYAVNEGKMNPNGYRIIKHSVSIKHLYWDGNSIAELGYDDGNNYAYADTLNNRKLLDAVTYDDGGNVIPLSKRFKRRNWDVRFSEKDSEGNTLSEGQIEFFRDSKVRDNKGRLAPVYHGTTINFNVFKKGDVGYHFGTKGAARGRAGYGKNVIIKEVYLNITNPIVFDEDLGSWDADYRLTRELYERGILSVEEAEHILFTDDKLYKRSTERANELLAKVLKSKGYDGIKYQNTHETKKATTSYIAFSPEQIKLTSNTNPTDSNDTRYSEKEQGIYDVMGETERIRKENEAFKAEVERLKERLKIERKVTNGNYFNENQLGAVAGHLRNISKSNMDKVELMKSLKDVYSFIAHSENLTWEEVFEKCYSIAESMIAEAKPLTIVDDYSKYLLREIRNTRISLDETQKKEAEYHFGKNWNRHFMGKVIIANDAINIDAKWQEWANSYPDIFDADTNSGDMIGELYDIIDSLKEASETIDEYGTEEQKRWLAKEIYNQYWNVSPIRTTADKYDKQIKRLNFEHRRAMSELRDDYNTRLKEQHKLDREKQKKLIAEIRERKDAEIAYAKEHGREMMSKYKENATKKTLIQRVTANSLSLKKSLEKNSKDNHVPEILKGPVIKLLTAIDFSSKRMLEKGIPTMKDIAFKDAFASIQAMLKDAEKNVDGLEDLYGHDLAEQMKLLSEAAENLVGDNNYIINAMSVKELQALDKLVSYMKSAVNRVNKFHVTQHNAGVQALGIETTEDVDSAKKIYKDHKKHFDKLKTKTYWNQLNPYYAFKNLGKSAMKVFKAFMDGQDKIAFLSKEVIDFAESVYSDKDYKKWEKTFFDFEIRQPSGKIAKFTMNVPQIMSLYCVAKQEDARKHLLHGNQVGDDIGKGRGITLVETDKTEAVRTNILLTEADLNNILAKLDTDEVGNAKEVADKLQEFMATRGAELGNEISMARWGIKSFGVENYFPIKVSDGAVPDKGETPGVQGNPLIALLNMSFTHSRNQFASQSIEIGDVFDVFSNHMASMIQYNAMALPVLDMYKWMNCKVDNEFGEEISVKTSIKNTFGDYAWGYFNTFLKDVNGTTKNDTRDNLGVKFFKNAKVAKVAANIRVALLQFTSYIRAGAVMDNKYLLRALGHKPKSKMAKEHCGIALWKSLGYYDTDITTPLADKIKHSDTWKDKAIELSLKGAEKADEWTWGILWNACELEVRDTRKDLKVGSEEFYKEIGLRLREVVYRTQVVDSQLTRSQMMRSKSGWDKMLTTFASESTLSFNLITDLFVSYKLDSRRMGKEAAKQKHGKYIRKGITAYVVTNVVTTVIASMFDAFRDYDEEDKDEEYITKLMLENFATNTSFINKIPYINLFVSIISGFSPSRVETDWMESASKGVKELYKLMTGEGSGEKAFKYLLKALSDSTGIAGYNLYRDVRAFIELFN